MIDTKSNRAHVLSGTCANEESHTAEVLHERLESLAAAVVLETLTALYARAGGQEAQQRVVHHDARAADSREHPRVVVRADVVVCCCRMKEKERRNHFCTKNEPF